MNILYLSNIAGEGFSGLTYSVPSQIYAQSDVDNVYWYNFMPIERESWRQFDFYHNSNDVDFALSEVERSIGNIDLIVFEGFYNFHPTPTILSILGTGIPYVIVPRCALTKGDQGKKVLKKRFCNALFYSRFAKNAASIHYLTKREKEESGLKWNSNSFVAPNGISSIQSSAKHHFHKGIRAVYIGRYEPYQKGLDVLMDALALASNDLTNASFKLDMYGNAVNGSDEWLKGEIEKNGLNDVVTVHGPIYDQQKRDILLDSDLFVLTSRYEGMPMGLLEACSYGLPSIVTPGTNMMEDFDRLQAGFVCELDKYSIADAFVRAACCSDSYFEMSQGALRIAEKYLWTSIAKDVHAEYERIIRGE